MLHDGLMFYIKTTETCNLNCDHCFTSGRNGRKIFFDPVATANWVNQLADRRTAHFEYHGGEPFLAPIKNMWEFYYRTSEVWANPSYGITTNLVHKLTEDKLQFMDEVLNKRIGTSWDPKIRFDNDKQVKLWEDNIALLLERGYTIKLFVSLTRDVVNMDPIDLLTYMKRLGVQEVSIERVTSNGYAKKNLMVFPTNIEMQKWTLEMHNVSEKHNARRWFHNEFLENIYTKFETGFTRAGTFCRNCEQKMFTINADGTVAGCPNSAPEDHYTAIHSCPTKATTSEKRCSIIAAEVMGDPRCYNCSLYKYCGGDCHQLAWEGDVCPAPKLLMKQLDKNINGNTF